MISKIFSRLGFIALLVLGAPAAHAQENQSLDERQVEAVQKIVRDYLRNNPEIVVEALEALREKERAEAELAAQKVLKDSAEEIFNDPAAPIGGNPKGDVVLVEFFDYRCTYCKAVSDTVHEVIKADGKVKLVYKELPILGPESLTASKAALAARGQKKYVEFHRALMKARAPLTEQTIFKIAADTGLNVEQLQKDMNAPEIESALKKNHRLAANLNISGTPAFVIGDRIIPGAIDPAALKQIIEQTRRGGKS